MFIGALTLDLTVPDSFSLKDKRRVVKSLKDRISHRFNVSIAEVASLDLHRTAELGVAIVSNDAGYAEGALAKIVDFIRNDPRVVLESFDIEIL
jgi:uncharacterized protein YlxP (DUF503 family)